MAQVQLSDMKRLRQQLALRRVGDVPRPARVGPELRRERVPRQGFQVLVVVHDLFEGLGRRARVALAEGRRGDGGRRGGRAEAQPQRVEQRPLGGQE